MNLRQRGRLRRYGTYAIGEVVLIVVGIMIALSLDSWWTARQERAEERELLVSLQADYRANLSSLRADREKLTNLVAAADRILKYMDGVEAADPARDLRRLTAYSTFDPSNGALNDIIGSGALELIKSDSLRIRLSRWEGLLGDVKEDEQRLMQLGDNFLAPYRFERMRWDGAGWQWKYDPARDNSLRNIVLDMRGHAQYIIDANYNRLEAEIVSTLDAIQAALE
jgi:hypothetical protein